MGEPIKIEACNLCVEKSLRPPMKNPAGRSGVFRRVGLVVVSEKSCGLAGVVNAPIGEVCRLVALNNSELLAGVGTAQKRGRFNRGDRINSGGSRDFVGLAAIGELHSWGLLSDGVCLDKLIVPRIPDWVSDRSMDWRVIVLAVECERIWL